jgi:subtilisin-like proprotein convertase family protein
MKFTIKFTSVFAAMCLAVNAHAQLATNTFAQSPNTLIPDANPVGLFSTNLVSGVSGVIQSVNVTLNITGGWNGDLYAYLSFGNGFAVLLNRVGVSSYGDFGYGDAGFNITFSDSAATDIHSYGGNGGLQLTGIFQPDGRNVDPQLVLASDLRTSILSSFDNMNPNGTWTLFVADMASDYQSTFVDWSLTIVTVPEPTTTQLLAVFGGLAATVFFWRRRRQLKP